MTLKLVTSKTAESNTAEGLFSRWQPEYAARNIATFPVRISSDEKKPAVRNYSRMGLSASASLVPKFADANAFGFMAGERSNVTILDIDTPDGRVLSDALNRHGHTPLVVRSGSGKYHAYFRHNGERRHIRPWRGLPIDLLGGGYVVAPPSRSAKGQYEIIQGSLDDLDRLPVLRNLDFAKPEGAKDGERGDELFRHLMRAAHHVDSKDDLVDVGRTFGDNCEPPMEDSRVISTVESVWGYTVRGENRFGRKGVFFDNADIIRLTNDDPDLYLMLSLVRAHNGLEAKFIMTIDWLSKTLGWRRHRVVDTRRRLIAGYAKQISAARPGRAAYFRWKGLGVPD